MPTANGRRATRTKSAGASVVPMPNMMNWIAGTTSVVSFTQDAAALALSTDVAPMRAAYRARRDLVLERLDGMGLPVVRPEGAFYAFPRIEELGLGSRDFCVRAAREAGVALVPGAAFGAEGHVRLSYACADDALVRGLDRLGDFVGALRP